MLGAKGERIMEQMEELTADDDLSDATPKPAKQSEQPAAPGASLDLFGAEVPPACATECVGFVSLWRL